MNIRNNVHGLHSNIGWTLFQGYISCSTTWIIKEGGYNIFFLIISALMSEAKHCNNTKLLEPVYDQRQLSRYGLMCNFGQVVDFTYNRPILSCLILSYCLWRKFFAESSSSYFCCNSRSWWENYDLVSVFVAPTLNTKAFICKEPSQTGASKVKVYVWNLQKTNYNAHQILQAGANSTKLFCKGTLQNTNDSNAY